jgi:RNA polymerase sigma-70 factor (ECF subfamily)
MSGVFFCHNIGCHHAYILYRHFGIYLVEEMKNANISCEESVENCYKSYSAIIMKFLKNYVPNYHIAEEIKQEVFLRLFERGISLNPESISTRNYLFSVAKHLAFDYLRRIKTEKRKYDEIYIEEVRLNSKFYKNLENAHIEGEIKATLYDTINSLPHHKREVFIKKFFLMRKNKEIIRELNISRFILKKIVREIKDDIRVNMSKYFLDE